MPSLDDGIIVSITMKAQDTRMALVKRIFHHMRSQLDALEQLMSNEEPSVEMDGLIQEIERDRDDLSGVISSTLKSRVLEGVFDGQHMIAEDGKQYLVPPNYASKSKLVEGDLLRLMIAENGRFIFKQRGPIDRERCMGMLVYSDQADEWFVIADDRKFKILPASVSFFKGQANDEAIILIPRDNPSSWAALENIIRRDVSEFEV